MDYTQVKQASYLTADNAGRYRRIMHYCYEQNQRMNNLLYRQDILAGVRAQGLPGYTDEQLDVDLNSLVAWGNLTARQEMSQPRTIEEFKNKFFRYQITAAGVALEELIEHLPQDEAVNGELDAHLFSRLLATLQELAGADGQHLTDTWDDLLARFDRIRKGATAYVGYLTSSKVESLMQTTAFLAYKAQFIRYLRDFIQQMQQTILRIQSAIDAVPATQLDDVATSKAAQLAARGQRGDVQSDASGTVCATWDTIRRWFVDQDGRTSEYHNLMEQTTAALNRVTRVIQTLTESMQQHRSRSQDYRQIAGWFQDIADSSDTADQQRRATNQLASLMFGFEHPQHLQMTAMEIPHTTDDLWQLALPVTTVESKSRKYRSRDGSQPFTRRPEERQRLAAAYRERLQTHRDLWRQYLVDGSLHLADHPTMPRDLRRDLLRYLSRALMVTSNTVRTDLGWTFKVDVDRTREVRVTFDDGTLTMPDVTYSIVGGTHHD